MVIEALDNVKAFVARAIQEANPNADVRRGTPVWDFLVQPLSFIFEDVFETIDDIRQKQSLVNLNNLDDDDVDALLANIFVTRRGGDTATGIVRIFFDAPISFTLSAGTIFLSADGQRFLTQTAQSITEPQMSLNVFGSLFFFDVDVVAESPGASGAIEEDEIVSVLGVQTDELVQVSNPSPFIGGVDRETNEEVVARAADAITERSIVTSPGATTILLEQFPIIETLQPIGFGDPEMIRDILNGENMSLGGREFPDAEDVHIGGKVDYYLQIGSTESLELDMLTTTLRNRLRSRDALDGTASVDETFHIQGGVITDVSDVGGSTVITDSNISLIVDELIGQQIEFLRPSREARQRFTVIDNDTDTITLATTADVEIGDSFFVTDQITRPILAISQIEEIDPVSLTPLGVFLTEGEDYVLDFEEPALALSDIERISILFTEFGGTIDQVNLDGFGDTIVTDDDLSMTPSAYAGEVLRLVKEGTEFTILDNTATTFKISDDVTSQISAEDDYAILGGSSIGRAWRVTYTTQPNITQIQDFLLSNQIRVLTADPLAKSALPVFVDMTVSIQQQVETFPIDASAVSSAIQEYLGDLQFGGLLESSDIIDLIYETLEAGRRDIGILPFTFDVEFRSVAGVLTTLTDQDIRINDRTQVFSPRSISITVV